MIERIALWLDPVAFTTIAKNSGPMIPANFSKTLKKPKNSPECRRRDHRGEQRAAECLGSALHGADQAGENDEMERRGHEIADDADPHVHHEPQKDRPLGADVPGEPAEEKRERNPDELHRRDRPDHDGSAEMPLLAIDRRHPDDGADAVVVDQERHQQQEGLLVGPKVLEGLGEMRERRAERAGDTLTAPAAGRRRLGNPAEERDGEDGPPDGR